MAPHFYFMNSKQELRPIKPSKKTDNFVSHNRRPDGNPQSLPIPKKSARDTLPTLVAEYLEATCCAKALEFFRIQSQRQRADSDREGLLRLFDNGSRDLFFTKLNKLLPASSRNNNDSFKKLEFYLQVYFFAVRKPNANDAALAQHFINYLDTRGSDLSKTTELLPYFALPYMQRPAQHPAVEHIFRKKWASELRQKLNNFIEEQSSHRKQCRLQQLYSAACSVGTENQYPSSDKEKQLLEELSDFQDRYARLQNSYKEMTQIAKANLLDSQAKWFSLAKDLVSISNRFMRTLEKNGLMTAQTQPLADKLSKYEVFLNSNIDDLIAHSNNAISLFQQPSISEIDRTQNPQHHNRTSLNLLSLDFEKIKSFLNSGQDQISLALLLQALRWRITKAKDPYSRREIIMGYTLHDMLGIKEENKALLGSLLSGESELVKEHSLRLVNVIASDYNGRSYLTTNCNVLEKLSKIVKEEDYDGIIRRCALNALQKVSLRSMAQNFMIEKGIIRWIVQTLKLEKDDLSQTSLQYLTALLMNLTLKRAGKLRCEKQQMLQLLASLMEIEDEQVRTFVSGSIFSLLTLPKIREQANRIGLAEQLSQYLDNQSQQFTKQISYILQKLQEEDAEDDEEPQDEDLDGLDDIDEDEQEQEGDYEESEEEDRIPDDSDERDAGEDLLIKRFSCVGPEAVRQECLTRSILEEALKRNLEVSIIREKRTNRSFLANSLFRPTTPIKSGLEILEAMQEKPNKSGSQKQPYNSNNYLANFVSFRKQPVTVQQQAELLNFVPKPLIPRTPPQTNYPK